VNEICLIDVRPVMSVSQSVSSYLLWQFRKPAKSSHIRLATATSTEVKNYEINNSNKAQQKSNNFIIMQCCFMKAAFCCCCCRCPREGTNDVLSNMLRPKSRSNKSQKGLALLAPQTEINHKSFIHGKAEFWNRTMPSHTHTQLWRRRVNESMEGVIYRGDRMNESDSNEPFKDARFLTQLSAMEMRINCSRVAIVLIVLKEFMKAVIESEAFHSSAERRLGIIGQLLMVVRRSKVSAGEAKGKPFATLSKDEAIKFYLAIPFNAIFLLTSPASFPFS